MHCFHHLWNNMDATKSSLQAEKAKLTSSGWGGGLYTPGLGDKLGMQPPLPDKPDLCLRSNETDIATTASWQPVLPSLSSPSKKTSTMYHYRAQLTFGLKAGCDINVPSLFSQFLPMTLQHLSDFSLLSFHDDKGQKIQSIKQLPDNNPEFLQLYYHIYRVLQHGNLTRNDILPMPHLLVWHQETH